MALSKGNMGGNPHRLRRGKERVVYCCRMGGKRGRKVEEVVGGKGMLG